MPKPSTSIGSVAVPTLPRIATWEEWEAGRAARRAVSIQITGGKTLRRHSGNPRKDILLRRLNDGERGLPFRFEKLKG